jgi:thiol-disulfide isomerase/thioredoxin
VFKKSLVFAFLLFICIWPAFVQQPCAIGQKAPSLIGITIYGDTLTSESFKRGVVLVDFWSSWNIPSRKHNLTTKKIYEKYRGLSIRKKRQFTVLQVSLDTRRDLLSLAISKDNLPWRTQFCDFKGWHSPYAAMFDIKKLPSNFLIDTAGVIIATNIWGDELEGAVKKQLE